MSNSLPSSQINIRRNVISAPLTEARDAYQLAKMRDPSIGTLDEWIASLKGAPGADGKSAYQTYLETTSDDPPMTEEEWSDPGGAELTSYDQVSRLPHYPESFPPAAHNHDSAYRKLPDQDTFTSIPNGPSPSDYIISASDSGKVLAPGDSITLALPLASSLPAMEFYVLASTGNVPIGPAVYDTARAEIVSALAAPAVWRVWNMGSLWFCEGKTTLLHNGTLSGTFAVPNALTTDAMTQANLRLAAGAGAVGGQIFGAADAADVNAVLMVVTKKLSSDATPRANTTTFVADTVLGNWTLAANTSYKIEFSVFVACGAGGFAGRFALPSISGSSGHSLGQQHGYSTATLTQNVNNVVLAARTSATSGAMAVGFFTIRTGAGGLMNFEWAQNAPDASNTYPMLGSVVRVTEL